MVLTAFDAALASVIGTAQSARLPDESVALGQACGRILAEDVRAPFAVPGFDHSAMDGFAIARPPQPQPFELLLDVSGRVLAGDPPFRTINAGEAVEVATGAIVPEGTDRVVPVEASVREGQQVRLRLQPDALHNIRGGDDDYRRDQLALLAGAAIGFAACGVLASFGRTDVRVASRPRVAVLVSGSELVPAHAPRAPGRIHDSNGPVLRGLLRGEGIDAQLLGPLPDAPAQLRAALQAAAANSDVVITTGGASVGQADYMPRLLAELGEIVFWKVAMRPGMPVLFARIGKCLVFALPGNPVAVVAGFLSLVRPALRVLQGAMPPARTHARLLQPLQKLHDRLEFRRGVLGTSSAGVAEVSAHPALSSGVLRSVVETNALIMLDADRQHWPAGAVVEVLCYDSQS